MNDRFCSRLKERPVIAAVKDLEEIDAALNSECSVVFLLCGSIFNLKEIVEKAKEADKMIFIHADLIEGFSRDAVAMRYIAKEICPDGIISTKSSLLKAAKELGLFTVQRLFIVDSLSVHTTEKSTALIRPDVVEVLPGIAPRIIRQIALRVNVPVIAGGLVSEEGDVYNALQNGAIGASTSCKELWNFKKS